MNAYTRAALLIIITIILASASCSYKAAKLTANGVSYKTILYNSNRIYCSDGCHTHETTLYSNKSFYTINTICDVAAHNITFGKFELTSDTIKFKRDFPYFFSSNVVVNKSQCENEKVNIILKEYLPDGRESSLFYYYLHSAVVGETYDGEIGFISKESLSDYKKILISAASFKGYKNIWLEIRGKPIGLKLELPKNYNCLEIEYPIVHGNFQTNWKHPKLFFKLVKEESKEGLKIKTPCEIRKENSK